MLPWARILGQIVQKLLGSLAGTGVNKALPRFCS
jgi:hypothetical protein